MVQGTFRYGLEWGTLNFRYDPAAVAAVKLIPGRQWDKERKLWRLPMHAIPAMQLVLAGVMQLNLIRDPQPIPELLLPENVISALRPYQLQGVASLVTYPGFILSFDLRVGKTVTALGAAASMLTSRAIDSVLVLYPSSVQGEWVHQPKQWIGLDSIHLEGHTALTDAEVAELVAKPYLMVGCSYELLGKRYEDLIKVFGQRKFAVIADEGQNLKNRRSGRYAGGIALAKLPTCVRRWVLTGTPMRNRPADSWAVFDFVQPGSMGSFFDFAKRYCAAHEGEYGWVYTGTSNEEELAARLAACSYRVTRADAGVYLPQSERQTILCSMNKETARQYAALEQGNAAAIKRALASSEPAAVSVGVLKKLAAATAEAKIPTAVERIKHHCEERRVKTLVMATFHESLKSLWDVLEPESGKGGPLEVPVFVAGGWMLPDKRRKIIDTWKATPGPGVLLANTLSSGIGIDLSDADVCIFLELCWVPADFIQAEGRIQDIHQGKRKTPPLYEYLLTKATVDADMGLALINKQSVINAVVGKDRESGAMAEALRDSGVVNSSNLSLDREDPDAVNKALAALQRRLLGIDDGVGDDNVALAAAVGEAFQEEESQQDELEELQT